MKLNSIAILQKCFAIIRKILSKLSVLIYNFASQVVNFDATKSGEECVIKRAIT